MLYETLLLAAVLFAAAFVFTALFQPPLPFPIRVAFQGYLVAVTACYFMWYWLHGGQTLPMKTWHLRVIAADGQPLRLEQAAMRFIYAALGIFFVFGILWALIDRDRLFWHDRMAGTRVIMTK